MDPINDKLDAISASLDTITARLETLLNGPKPKIISVRECMPITGCKSLPAMHRWFVKYQVKPYAHGKYLRLAVENRVASLALFGK